MTVGIILRILKELFDRLRRDRITAQPTKCLLGSNWIEFLGHHIGGDVITPSGDNLDREGTENTTSDHQEVSEILSRISGLL